MEFLNCSHSLETAGSLRKDVWESQRCQVSMGVFKPWNTRVSENRAVVYFLGLNVVMIIFMKWLSTVLCSYFSDEREIFWQGAVAEMGFYLFI